MKPIVFVGHDAAPSRCFMRLADALKTKGQAVTLIVADGKPDTATVAQVEDAVAGARVVVLGMSSRVDLAALEIAAGRAALKCKVPYGFYSDIPNCHNREWFGDLREESDFWFVPNEIDEKNLVEVGFGDALVAVTGNPLREEDFFLRFSRAEVRERLKVGEDEKLILAPGGKSPAVNLGLWSALLDALDGLRHKCRVFLAMHPGDRTPFATDQGVLMREAFAAGALSIYKKQPVEVVGEALRGVCEKAQLNIYGDLLKFVPENVRVEILPVEKDVFGTTEAVAGADLVVEYGSSAGMTAGAQRVPCITVKTAVGCKRNFSVSKSDTTEAVECGASQEVDLTSTEQLYDFVNNFLDGASLAEDQEAALPKPSERGESVRLMCEELMKFASD